MRSLKKHNINESFSLTAALGGITKGGIVAIVACSVLLTALMWWLIYKSRLSFTEERGIAVNKLLNQYGTTMNLWVNPITSNYCVVFGQDKSKTMRIIFDMGFNEIDLRNTEDTDTREAIAGILDNVHANRQVLTSIAEEAILHSTREEVDLLKRQGTSWGDTYINQEVVESLKTKISGYINKFNISNTEKAKKKKQLGMVVIAK